MKYFTVQNKGRLGNQLYYGLYCWLNGFKFKSDYSEFNIQMRRLNIPSIVSIEEENNSDIEYEILPVDYDLQNIGDYIKITDIHKFIKETILKSSCFNEIYTKYINTISKDDYAISIRNGDYYQFREFLLPNRDQYIEKYLSTIKSNTISINIFSDDMVLSKKLYQNLFLNKTKKINYLSSNDPVFDMLYSALYMNKCIMNSTFHYWSAFISNCLYENYQNIYCPNKVHNYDNDNILPNLSINGIHMSKVLDPRWNIQKIGD